MKDDLFEDEINVMSHLERHWSYMYFKSCLCQYLGKCSLTVMRL